MKPAALLVAGLLSAALLTPLISADAQTRSEIVTRRGTVGGGATLGAQRANMLIFGTGAAPMHPLIEQGTLLRSIIGPADVTGVSGGTMTFRTRSGMMAGIHMPAARIQAMRLMAGTHVRFTLLSNRQFELQVTGGRRAPLKRPIQ